LVGVRPDCCNGVNRRHRRSFIACPEHLVAPACHQGGFSDRRGFTRFAAVACHAGCAAGPRARAPAGCLGHAAICKAKSQIRQRIAQFWSRQARIFAQSSLNSARCSAIPQEPRGVVMPAFRRLSSQETEPGHPIALFRQAPQEVLAERDAAWANDLTPNMAVLGDPLPGRSALDARLRRRIH